jgi:dephospho-CoA kinase
VPALGITGGIATGKSSFTEAFLRHLPTRVFDADRAVHELLASDDAVRAAVREAFGASAFALDGSIDRAWLRERVFANADARRTLEAIVHPAVRERWSALAAEGRAGKDWLCFDIPLLYETQIEGHFDRVIVVACSPGTQRERLKRARGLSDDIAARMIAAQLDLREKILRADHLIWNDSTTAVLEAQAALIANWLRNRYGN